MTQWRIYKLLFTGLCIYKTSIPFYAYKMSNKNYKLVISTILVVLVLNKTRQRIDRCSVRNIGSPLKLKGLKKYLYL